jgi:geranylgeranyl pyrophosphate synthase
LALLWISKTGIEVNFDGQLQAFRTRIENGLRSWVPLSVATPARLSQAMHHSLFAGGKRVRPVLLLAAFDLFPCDRDPLPAAVALECLHTYSLIHDDLPGMDNSDLRRGVPTCHVAFDDATAILAGDALLTLAFEILVTRYAHDPALACALVRELASAAGSAGMIGGQMQDVLSDRAGESIGMEQVRSIEDHKTGALFQCSLRMGLMLASAPSETLALASEIGLLVGRAFQVVDDLLDAEGDEMTVGKTLKIDARNCKATAVSHYGIEGARREAALLHQQAQERVGLLGGDPRFLSALLDYLLHRAY